MYGVSLRIISIDCFIFSCCFNKSFSSDYFYEISNPLKWTNKCELALARVCLCPEYSTPSFGYAVRLRGGYCYNDDLCFIYAAPTPAAPAASVIFSLGTYKNVRKFKFIVSINTYTVLSGVFLLLRLYLFYLKVVRVWVRIFTLGEHLVRSSVQTTKLAATIIKMWIAQCRCSCCHVVRFFVVSFWFVSICFELYSFLAI